MSDERFDKLIKTNLDSVRPAYQPRAWDRFRKRLPMVGFWPWFMQYGGWGISGLMLAGWLMTLYTLHTNQQVLSQLSRIRALPVASVAEVPTPGAQSVNRVDTVYIVKRTVIEHKYSYAVPGDWGPDMDRRPGSASRKKMARSNEPLTEEADNKTKGGLYVQTKPGRNRLPPVLPGHISGEENNDANRDTGATSLRLPLDQTSPHNDSLSRKEMGESPNILAAHPDSVTQKSLVMPPPPTQPAGQSRPRFKLASLQPRLGIESMGARNGFGIGPVIEVFPVENLGFSVGLQASQFHLENHRALTDFNAATGQNFVEQYRAFLPAQYDKIEDISIQTSVINVPIRLNYYIPLRQRWSLFIQAGTRLDVAAYQQVRYESYWQMDEQYHSFEVHTAHRLFHNFLFGAGLQYRKPRLSLQVAPYYNYDFRSIINTPASSNFGLKASVWLDLFK